MYGSDQGVHIYTDTDMTLPLHTKISLATSMLLSAAIFGFFFAWVCSTMWGLDAIDPRVAIEAMQAMNASVRNAVFFPAFFLTPLALLVSAALLWRRSLRRSAGWFAAAALTYFALGLVLTMTVHVPLNEALALIEVPADLSEAQAIWAEYSPTWQLWNQTRTVTCGLSFLMAVLGLLALGEPAAR